MCIFLVGIIDSILILMWRLILLTYDLERKLTELYCHLYVFEVSCLMYGLSLSLGMNLCAFFFNLAFIIWENII
jgi:hypothetical protein